MMSIGSVADIGDLPAHVVGDLDGAIESYQASLRERPTHRIQRATIYRIAIAVNHFLITKRQ